MSNSGYLKSNGWKHKAGGWWIDPRAEKGAPLVKTADAVARQKERDAAHEAERMAPVKVAEGFASRYTPNPAADRFRALSADPNNSGAAEIYRYRITVERIEEPRDVIVDRLRRLWAAETNHHRWNALQAEAKRLGVELKREDQTTAQKKKNT